LQHTGLKHMAVDALYGLGQRGFIRQDFIDTLLEQHLPAHPNYYGEMVWILMMLEQWLRQHAPHYRLA
jgi:asparagine synthase (glutamine-hydrolysing)